MNPSDRSAFFSGLPERREHAHNIATMDEGGEAPMTSATLRIELGRDEN